MREKIASGTVDSSVQSRFCVRISGRDHFVWVFRQLQTVSFFSFFPWGLLWVCRQSSELWPSQNKDIAGAITLRVSPWTLLDTFMSCSKGEGGVSYLQILVCTKTRITKFGVVSNQSATWFSLTIRLHFSKRSLSTAACDIIFTSRTDLASSQATVVGKQNIEHLFGWTRDVLWSSLANTNQGYRNAAVCDLLKAEKKQDISYVLPLILFKLCIKNKF